MGQEKIEVLVNRAKAGDPQAMEQLLLRAHTSVSYQCRKMMGNAQDAEDLTQEVLITVYTKLNTLEEPAAFWGWLHRITATKCINALNRMPHEFQFAEDDEGNSVLKELPTLDERQVPDQALDNAETARMIDEIVSQLPDMQKLSVLMYYYDEMSVKEIAQIMGVPEGTVKSRLNLARNTIENKVRNYEKQGIKLYSVSILPFLWYFLRTAAVSEAKGSTATACVTSVIVGEEATAAATTTTTVAGTVGGTAVGSLLPKVIAGVIAASLMITGGMIGANKLLNRRETDSKTEASTNNPDDLSAVYAAYEALLTKGITEQENLIEYYAYLDLNQDGVPELIVADADGTPESWTIVEMYSYADSDLCYWGTTNSRYDYLYYVNEAYLLGRHRMGNQYLSADGFLEYAEEEFDYYNRMPDKSSEDDGFIKTATPIAFKKNQFAPISEIEVLQMFYNAKDFYDTHIYGKRFVDASVYRVQDFDWIDGVIEYQGGLYQPTGYDYDEFIQKLRELFAEDAVKALVDQVGLIKYEGNCYTYIREGMGDAYLGEYEVEPTLTVDGYYQLRISYMDMDGSKVLSEMTCKKIGDQWVFNGNKFYSE